MTIKDIARLSGYAVGTVSRVLNDRPDVSEEARAKVLAVVEAHHFTRNSNAKHLKQQASSGVALIVKGTQNMLFADLVERIQTRIRDSGYPSLIYYIDEDDDEIDQAIRVCRERRPMGILFLGSNLSLFQTGFSQITIPCVLVTNNARALGLKNLSSVSTDDVEAAREAIDTLVEMGHRKIAIIGGDRAVSDTSRLRYEGCMESFAGHGIAFDTEKDYQGVRYSCLDGYQAVRSLLGAGRRFTAIFATADVMAIGAIRALWEAGLRVPEDVSVMGVDGLPLGDFLVPQLATVRQNVPELARRSVEILLDAIENDAPACHELVPFTIARRESVRPISTQGVT